VPKLTPAFVAKWSGRYPLSALETQLFGTDGPAIKKRGHLFRSELLDIAYWKSGGRNVGSIDENNTDWEIRETSKAAFAAPQGIQHRILATLHGVNVRMATAILAVVYPKRDTVLDVRALSALAELRRLGDLAAPLPLYSEGLPLYSEGLPAYADYVKVCADLARGVGCDLRTLDRTLWTWDKAGLP
jgi:hypothetical protein